MSALNGEIIVVGQHEGGDIQLRIFGDEFYARYETTGGYTAVYDTSMGQYCFAILTGGRFASSGVPCHRNPPSGLRKHLHEDGTVRALKFDHKYSDIRPWESTGDESATRTLGLDNGLLTGRKLHSGDVKGLTILVNFADVKTAITREEVEAMMNGDDFTLNGNFGSVRKYYQLMSVGKLNYSNTIIGPVELSRRRSYYIDQLLVKEALDLAVNEFNVDLSEFDSRREGYVDAINILYAGRSQYNGMLWPHNSVKRYLYGGIMTHYYMLSGIGSNRVDLNIGTVCHENGHMLCRFPDVYDYGTRDNDQEKSFGLGYYCLMSSGNYLNGGRTPAPVSAYLRDLAGWTNKAVSLNNPGEYVIRHGDYGRLFKYHTHLPNEYFLIENRLRLGLDEHLPSNGLAVYHCDTLGSNEWQQGSASKHYQIALLQADGHLDLEKNRNQGDRGDMFIAVAGVAADDSTVPHTRHWDGSGSGLRISDISIEQDEIRFSVGELASSKNISAESSPDLAIPDNDDAGTEDSLTLDANGVVESLELEILIMHPSTRDLLINLIPPDGTSVTVYEDAEVTGSDLVGVFNTDDLLAPLIGTRVQGKWRLQVIDRLQGDVGKLVFWGMNIVKGDDGYVLEARSEKRIAIPEQDILGIADALTLATDSDARIRQIAVSVNISHSYADDLMITLKSPEGTEITLLNNGEIGDQADLNRIFDMKTTPVMQRLINEVAAGTWTLCVADMNAGDIGHLKGWGLRVVCDSQ